MNSFVFCYLFQSTQPAIRKQCKLGGLEKTEIYFSQFWRLEVLDQGASTVMFWFIAASSHCVLFWWKGLGSLQDFFFFFFFNNLFYFWLHWVFIVVRRLSLVAVSGGYSSLQCVGFSLRWLLVAEHRLQVHRLKQLWLTGSREPARQLWCTGCRCTGLSSCGSRVLESRLGSCGARAQLPLGMWDLPGPGLEPMSPALAGGFLTTVPPGKPSAGSLL